MSILNFNYFDDEMNKKLQAFMELVLKENEVMNLTAITDKNEFIEKHFYDSLLPSEVVNFNNKNIVDIGSGAGFPGIPLAIAFPKSKVTLIDPMQKRCIFLNNVVKELDLKNVTVICKRAEDLDNDLRESFDIVTARAVTNLRVLVELCVPYLKNKGVFVAYKGTKYQEEIDESSHALKMLNSKVTFIQNRKLPISKEDRFNIIITKEKNIDKKFPRDFSQIKKNPL
jgi:16S rRNA (guanine527-N7)-methyltransferase